MIVSHVSAGGVSRLNPGLVPLHRLAFVAVVLFLALFLVFPASAASPPSDAALQESIRRHRMGTLLIEAAPGTEVRVEQIRHEFWFGAALANHMFTPRADPETAAKYKKVFLENFNSAVTENALKWHSMEREKGKIDYSVVDAILSWCDQNKIPLRGHNVFWGVPKFVQPWQKELDDNTLRQVLKDRAVDVARRYRGRFAEYDLNNEMLHANYYADRLGAGITKEMADWMLKEDPKAVLYLNDYDILTGRRVEDYIRHIRDFLDQGVPFRGIGVQGHSHGDTFDPAALHNALERLAQLKLPIKVTEFNLPGQHSKHYGKRDARLTPEEEQAKAKALVDYYRICFAHPAVEGILMWGFWEGANWIPVSSLYRRDWSPTPAAEAYRKLIFEEWWTRSTIKTGPGGESKLPAFFGTYRITAAGKELIVDLKRSGPGQRVSINQAR